MFKLLGKIPNKVGVGCSGGVDSLSIVHFLMQQRKREVNIHYIWHGIEDSVGSLKSVQDFYNKHKDSYPNLYFHYHEFETYEKPEGMCYEHFWRRHRYSLFNSLDYPVCTGHHLNDVMENWIMTSLTGNPSLIHYKNNNVIRPFLLNLKKEFYQYAQKNNIDYYTDVSNSDLNYRRNRIRANVIPELMEIHPGFQTTIRNKILTEFYTNQTN